jgi:hypothetical protein
MQTGTSGHGEVDAKTFAFYRQALTILSEAQLPFLVGGAYALERYTGIQRHTKDIDVFVDPQECQRILNVFSAAGYQTEFTFHHWLAKVYGAGDFIDIIFSSGNGVARVDEGWFEHGVPAEVLGMPARLCPPEEMIWSKSYVMERERYDGADIAHLLRACGHSLDWERILVRFGLDWRVLLQHLILFGYIYPGERTNVPSWVLGELLQRLQREMAEAPPPDRVCQGILLSREQYLPDLERWGYADARLLRGSMKPDEIKAWTDAIQK